MIPGIAAAISAAGRSPVSMTFTTTALDTTDGTTHTINSVDIGEASGDRIVQVWISCRIQATISAVTINGITATLGTNHSTAENMCSRMAYAVVPTGTSVTVVVTTSVTTSNCGLSVFRLTGYAAPPTEQLVNGTSPQSLTASLGANQAALVGATSDDNNAGASMAFTNATEKSDYQVEAGIIPHQGSAIVTASGASQCTASGSTGMHLNMQTWTEAA